MMLEGKSALVTGSGRGIGRGIALALAQQGCNVVIDYFRNRDDAEETAAAVEAFGVKSIVIKAHVGEEKQIALVDERDHRCLWWLIHILWATPPAVFSNLLQK